MLVILPKLVVSNSFSPMIPQSLAWKPYEITLVIDNKAKQAEALGSSLHPLPGN